MLHISLHLAVPLLAALAFYRPAWRSALLVLWATMAVDVDHLLASPIYDPERCSIGFHPLHGSAAIALYAVLFVLPPVVVRLRGLEEPHPALRVAHLVGLGLLIHMALDWGDCLL